MELLIIRHSETKKNSEDRFDILTDLTDNFTEFGLFQLEATKHFLLSEKLPQSSIILSGVRKRVKDTALYLSDKFNLKCDFIHGFLPIYPGTLSGLTQKEAWETYPYLMKNRELFSQNKIDGYEIRFPKGDNIASYELKTKKIILDELHEHKNYEKVILISHRSTILALLNIFYKEFGIQIANTYKYYETPIGCIDKIIFADKNFKSGRIERIGGYFNWLQKSRI